MKWNTSLGKCKVILIFRIELIKKGKCVSLLSCNSPPSLHEIYRMHTDTHINTNILWARARSFNKTRLYLCYSALRRFPDIGWLLFCFRFFVYSVLYIEYCVEQWSSKNKRAITFCRHTVIGGIRWTMNNITRAQT